MDLSSLDPNKLLELLKSLTGGAGPSAPMSTRDDPVLPQNVPIPAERGLLQGVDQTTTSATPEPKRGSLSNFAPAAEGPKSKGGFLGNFSPAASFLSDDSDKQSAQRRAMLMAGAAMMANSDVSGSSLMGSIGQGVGAGAQAFDDAQKNNITNQAAKLKLQQAQEQARLRNSLFGGGDGSASATAGGNGGATSGSGSGDPRLNPDGSFKVEYLHKVWEYQMKTGDEAGARDTLDKINKAQQKAASEGMVYGPDGKLQALPGYNEGLGATKEAEAAGHARGDANRSTNDQIEYQQYQRDQAAKGLLPDDFTKWMRDNKKSGSTTVNVGDGNPEGEYNKEAAKAQAKMHGELAAGYSNAVSDVATIDELKGSLKNNPGGVASGIQNYASTKFGIKLGENASSLEYANALINKLVPSQRPAGSGAMSDMDVEMFRQSLPQLMNTPEGNTLIINSMRGIAQYKVDLAKIAQNAMDGVITRQEASKQMQALGNPLDEFKNQRVAVEEKLKANKERVNGSGQLLNGAAQPDTDHIPAPTINTDEEFDKLPNGTRFIRDGKTWTKH